MEINIIIIVMLILSLGTGLSIEEEFFKDYLEHGENNNWLLPVCESVNNESVELNNTVVNESTEEIIIKEPVLVSGEEIFLMSDTHVFESTRMIKLQVAMDWVNNQDFSMVYFLGDNTDSKNKPEQRILFDNVTNVLNTSFTSLIGNHDHLSNTDWIDNDMKMDIYNNTCVMMFNTYAEEIYHGSWTQGQISWLENNIVLCDKDYLILLSHHGIYDPTYSYPPGAENIKEILDNSKDDFVKITHLRGHNHLFEVDTDNNINYITIRSSGHFTERDNALGIKVNTNTGTLFNCWTGKDCEIIGE